MRAIQIKWSVWNKGRGCGFMLHLLLLQEGQKRTGFCLGFPSLYVCMCICNGSCRRKHGLSWVVIWIERTWGHARCLNVSRSQLGIIRLVCSWGRRAGRCIRMMLCLCEICSRKVKYLKISKLVFFLIREFGFSSMLLLWWSCSSELKVRGLILIWLWCQRRRCQKGAIIIVENPYSLA